MIVVGAARRMRAEVRPPFIAHPHFVEDFIFVWGRPPVCCYCWGPVQAGELAGWLKAYRPDTLHHIACRRQHEAAVASGP